MTEVMALQPIGASKEVTKEVSKCIKTLKKRKACGLFTFSSYLN